VRLRIIAAGTKLPAWMNAGFDDYARRVRGEFAIELIEIPLGARAESNPARAIEKEGERMQARIDVRSFLVTLAIDGRALSTEALAQLLTARLPEGRDVAFVIGGPDGLAPSVAARADLSWSLSALTLPHGLARVLVAEALYRAVTVIRGHPYHRA
jgi:23S rRNA (pseudouridine1915-N3)-methyltransferase